MTTPHNYHDDPIHGNYTRIPNALLADPSLSPAAKMRYCTIAQYIDVNGWLFRRTHLANALGVSLKKGAKLDQELMLAGYVRKAQYRVKGVYTDTYYALYSQRRSTDGLDLHASFGDADEMYAYFLAAKPLSNRDTDTGVRLNGEPMPDTHSKIDTINTYINDDDVLCLQAQPTEVTEPLDLIGFMDNPATMTEAIWQLVEWDGRSFVYFASDKQAAWALAVQMLVALCLRAAEVIQRLDWLYQHGILPQEVLNQCVEVYAQRASAGDIRSPGRYMQAIIEDCMAKNLEEWEEI